MIALILLVSFFLASCGGAGISNSADTRISLDVDSAKPAYMGNTIENLNHYGLITYDGNNIYTGGYSYGATPAILKFDLAGGNETVLSGDYAVNLNVIGEWLYYENYSDTHIYRINVNGGIPQKISDKEAGFLLAYKDKLYVIENRSYGDQHLYAMNLDGTDEKCISDDLVEQIYIYSDCIYTAGFPGTNPIETGSIYKMGLDGSGKEKIFDYGLWIDWFFVYNDSIFFSQITTQGYGLFKVGVDGNNPGEIAIMKKLIGGTSNFDKGIFYYSSVSGLLPIFQKTEMHQMNLDTGATQSKTVPFFNRVGTDARATDYIVCDKIFRNENGKYFIMDLDGSNIIAWDDYNGI